MAKRLNIELYWEHPPPEPSPRLGGWMARIRDGWRPNSRIRGMGYYESAEFYGVYLWEYLHILSPMLRGDEPDAPGCVSVWTY